MRIKGHTFLNSVVSTLVMVAAATAHAEPPAASSEQNVAWPFFAFDNGVGRDQNWQPLQQAKLTSRLGFAGIGYSRVVDLEARYAACDAQDQRIFSFYESFSLGKKDPINPTTLQNLPRLSGRDAILWINVQGTASEAEAVAAFRELAQQAGKHGVRVVLYPHANTYVETGRHALRLSKAVDRDNFGMSINVCHELKAGRGDDMVGLVKDSIDHLLLVSVNGADRVQAPERERGWERLIQPLGEGDFDLLPLLNQLQESGYEGPIGLQCYRVTGEIEAILRKSIDAWHALVAKVPTR